MKEAKVLFVVPYGEQGACLAVCSYKCSNGKYMYGFCPTKRSVEVGALVPIGFYNRGDDYIMYIRKEDTTDGCF